MQADRATIREEMVALEKLNADYRELQKFGGLIPNKDRIVAGLSLLVGLTGISSAINEALKMVVTESGGEPLTIGLNAVLGVAGVGYYFVRKGSSK